MEACGLCLEASDCFGEIHELEVAGKTMQLARFTGGCLSKDHACKRLNRNGTLPYLRYCWGICPLAQKGPNLVRDA